MEKPLNRPQSSHFSSGPCAKRPGWSPEVLSNALLGRSHRSKVGKARIQEVITRSKQLLGIPEDYLCGIVPASDTGAVEMAMWSLLGARGVDMVAWESFGQAWVTDAQKQLKLPDCRTFLADYGKLPDLSQIDCDRDVVFTWNGTTSGVRVPHSEWIKDDRQGLMIADATSAVFAMEIPWHKLDVITWSWQKVMGGEAAHGMLVLSPRAVERLNTYVPPRPIPKLFQLTKKGQVNLGIFEGDTINTPSMLCVEDALDGLKWAESIGGLSALMHRSQANFNAIAAWVEQTPWVDFLAEVPETRSNTSICLKIVDPWYTELSKDDQAKGAKKLTGLLDSEGVAYDIASYRDAPPGIRIWGGATVETADIEALLPWLDWAFAEVKQIMKAD
ncbi:phosphoserine transaminase [Thermocoleostomius sinensis]|jgi:phosphoserine aminotransferase|uniref:phosphoserine transaminase n=1 Tax=Thermocoleostomius sinensis A174 TaxID=2016057 RepID=A0A9E8ZEK1_9CYAN|nr:phosphoserine transaminase [Thermocoleostomius sinensis]WAL61708.1 phosphoserine transaminase [Thermocoleostomius sinensis A174]